MSIKGHLSRNCLWSDGYSPLLPSAAVAGGAFPSPDVILTWRATNAREEKSYDLTSPADEREEGDDDGDGARSLPCRIVQLYREELGGKGRGGEVSRNTSR